MFGISSFSAVINPPQACILAVGAGIKKVLPPKLSTEGVSGDSKPKPRVVTTVTVQLSADRRVVDEAVASQFLQVLTEIKSYCK
jgi:pyruvate dehydrogenase E2 component (dihydrolipoamide acetyltransferase)